VAFIEEYGISGNFVRYYKKKVRYENISFRDICTENNWYVIRKKKKPSIGVFGNILLSGICLATNRQTLVTAINLELDIPICTGSKCENL
jgi:hypothetical protein